MKYIGEDMKDLWRENLRQLFLDFIDLGEDEEVWQRYLEIYDDLLAEVKRLREQICTCDGDGIAGSAYAGHIRKCACVEGAD